jgi:tetratricopeptide (TPR) repeat protein
MRNAGHLFFVSLYLSVALCTNAQPGTTVDLKKPEKYENRTLGSEKTTDGKLGYGKKLYQNTVTHYNYFFNAQNRLNEIIARAKQGSKDDYTKLLPYYNYTLDATSADPDIDSIIYKCNAGILLHDLRNDWVDDLYFLMGKAYYLRKNFDSAEHVFLYINYAFAPKDEGYDIPIGSNASGTVFTIATKEKTGFSAKLSTPPRRNEDLLWVARNYMDAGKLYEASGILEIVRNDPNFPERLQPELHETLGYLFYKEGIYDSAAFHLSKATDLDDNKQEKARREYLTAQLYMASGLNEDAANYFTRSADHTVDPVMAVYANLNAITASGDSVNTIDKKVAALLRLAHKDRYVSYRDMIYYAVAEAEIERKNYPDAYAYLRKSIKYNVDNPAQRSRSFMLLGDLDYLKPDYKTAANDYDSVDMSSLTIEADQKRLTERLTALQAIRTNLSIIHVEDSLQTVAHMPEGDRTALIKKTVRQLRKAQGLKDEENTVFVNAAVQQTDNNAIAAADLFGAAAAKGEWYFNNDALRSAGFSSFRATWGNRPNVDNWQRQDAVNKQIAQESATEENDVAGGHPDPNTMVVTLQNPTGEITYDALLANLPLTEDQIQSSNNKVADALFSNGQQFQNQLEDYQAAIEAYETLNKRFPDNTHLEEALFGLYYCYNKIGKNLSADSAKTVLNTKFKDGKFIKLLNNLVTTKTKQQPEDPATKEYEKIYDLFIEGNFEEAKTAKAKADSIYGKSYWTPQLLYIESIYYVSKREDSLAINRLSSVTEQFGSSPLAQKAQTMIDVLSRRQEIETYLTNLQITRLPEDEPSRLVDLNPVENIVDKKEIKRDSVVSAAANKVANPQVDTLKTISGNVRTYVFNASEQQFVALLLNKVDPVYATEARNAFNRYNQINLNTQKINVASSKLNDTLNVVLLGPFSDAATAMIYVNRVKPQAASAIIPWLKPEKYSFTIISQPNLDILNETKDLSGYKSLIEKVLPGKF